MDVNTGNEEEAGVCFHSDAFWPHGIWDQGCWDGLIDSVTQVLHLGLNSKDVCTIGHQSSCFFTSFPWIRIYEIINKTTVNSLLFELGLWIDISGLSGSNTHSLLLLNVKKISWSVEKKTCARIGRKKRIYTHIPDIITFGLEQSFDEFISCKLRGEQETSGVAAGRKKKKKTKTKKTKTRETVESERPRWLLGRTLLVNKQTA